ncbi:PucR family transcriptional regulator [Plantactinospora sp. DSM 117369]
MAHSQSYQEQRMGPLDVTRTFEQGLDELASRIGHSVSVDAPDGRLIAYSVQDGHADPARVASILSRKVTPEIQDWQLRHGIVEASGPVRVPANVELGMVGRVCIPMRSGDHCLGYLWVLEGERVLTPAALDRAVEAVRELTHILEAQHDLAGLGTYDVNTLVRLLLDGSAMAASARDRLASAMPSLLGARLTVCVAVPASADRGALSTLPPAVFRRLDASIPSALTSSPVHVGSFVATTHVAVVLCHRPDQPLSTGAIDLLVRTLNRCARPASCTFTVGISNPGPFDVDSVRGMYGQARAAADLAALDPALPRILPWSKVGPYRLLLQMAPLEPDPVLQRLDECGGSAEMLTRTLELYLDLGCDAQRTAESLQIHRTTLYYRLARIAKILDVDLAEGLVRLHLHVALKDRRLAARTPRAAGPPNPDFRPGEKEPGHLRTGVA